MSTQIVSIPSALLSLPANRSFRIIIDVTPVHGTMAFALPGSSPITVRGGLERLDLSISIEEHEGVGHD